MFWITVLKVVLMIVEVLVSIMLIGVILLQRTKSQGAGGLAFGAGMGEQIFGTQAGNVLTRTTIVLGIVFLVNTTALSVLYSRHQGSRSVVDSVPVPAAPNTLPQPLQTPPPGTADTTPPAEAAAPAPAQPAPATPAPAPAPAN